MLVLIEILLVTGSRRSDFLPLIYGHQELPIF